MVRILEPTLELNEHTKETKLTEKEKYAFSEQIELIDDCSDGSYLIK